MAISSHALTTSGTSFLFGGRSWGMKKRGRVHVSDDADGRAVKDMSGGM